MSETDQLRQSAEVPVRRYSVPALDGYVLSARRYSARQSRGCIVVASATGVPQGFYGRFAEHAAARGYDVVTCDYRGIGESAPSTLRGFRLDYRDWARLDLAGVLGNLASSDVPLHLVGHSYGGQALGLLPDPGLVRSMHAYGSGSGWHGWMPSPLERLRVRFMWGAVGPMLVRTFGYLAWGRLGMGEDLPRDVFRQWKHWCQFPGYWFDDPAVRDEMHELYARVTIPTSDVAARCSGTSCSQTSTSSTASTHPRPESSGGGSTQGVNLRLVNETRRGAGSPRLPRRACNLSASLDRAEGAIDGDCRGLDGCIDRRYVRFGQRGVCSRRVVPRLRRPA